jgi:hypothetical protein
LVRRRDVRPRHARLPGWFCATDFVPGAKQETTQKEQATTNRHTNQFANVISRFKAFLPSQLKTETPDTQALPEKALPPGFPLLR